MSGASTVDPVEAERAKLAQLPDDLVRLAEMDADDLEVLAISDVADVTMLAREVLRLRNVVTELTALLDARPREAA